MRALATAALATALACRAPRPAAPLAPPPLPHAAYARYLEGKLAAHRSDWPAAIAALQAAAKAAPDQPMLAVELARAQHAAKRSAEARATLAAARVRWPAHPEVWRASGDVLAAADRPAAIRAYRRAIELAPDDPHAYLGLAQLEPPAAAEATLRRLVARIPDAIEGHYQLAQRLARRGELARAIASLNAVLERDPDHLDARLDLARALRRTGAMAEAIAQTRSAFDRSGQALDIAEELYGLLCEADDRTAAIDLLTLLDDDRSDADALAQVARLQHGLGLRPQARAIAARLALVDAEASTLLEAELAMAPAPGATPVRPELVARLLAVPAGSPRFTDARALAAEARRLAGDPAGALAALAPALAARPTDVDLALAAARARADAGDIAGARAALARLGHGLAAALARARLEDHLGDAPAALALLEPLLRAHPDATAALNLAGYLLADANQRLDDAERWLRRARERTPGDPSILDSWGWLLYRKGDVRGAIRVLDQAARFAPHEPEILLHLATAHDAAGDPRAAARLLERASALAPPAAVQRRIDALRARLRARTPRGQPAVPER